MFDTVKDREFHIAYMENTKEAVEWMIILGYNKVGYNPDHKYIMTRYAKTSPSPTVHLRYEYTSMDVEPRVLVAVNCCGNLKLFKAVTAIVQGNNYMRWYKVIIPFSTFKTGEFLQRRDSSKHILPGVHLVWKDGVATMIDSTILQNNLRYASVGELIEHFKVK